MIMLMLVNLTEINGFMNSQEKTSVHLLLMLRRRSNNKSPKRIKKILDTPQVQLMRVYILSQVRTPMFYHFQEEEELVDMQVMDHKSQPIGLVFHRKDISTITNITRKILEKVALMKKFMESLLLILMSSHFQEEEEIQLMPVMDHKFPPTGLVSHRRNTTISIIKKILEKVELMKRFME